MAKKPALGKGLDSIFTDNNVEGSTGVTNIRLSEIEPKADQPRKSFNSETLSQLADSIAAMGVIQPILVRDVGGGFYQIIAGERRWRASKMAGLTEIPAIIMEADALRAAEVALIENIQRDDLNPYEEAEAYQMLLAEYELTQEEIASRIGKSRSAIANSLRLLELPDDIIEMIRAGKLTAGHGRALLGLKNKDYMIPLAKKAASRNLSVREIESSVKGLNKADAQSRLLDSPSENEKNGISVNYIADLENRAMSLIGRRVKISGAKNKKIVQIEYTDNDDLEALLQKICGNGIVERE
jgi:ParB-like partition proteins